MAAVLPLCLGILVAVLLLSVAVVMGHLPVALTLERAIPANHKVELSQLIARDGVRHGRLLESAAGVVDFSVEGTYDPFIVG